MFELGEDDGVDHAAEGGPRDDDAQSIGAMAFEPMGNDGDAGGEATTRKFGGIGDRKETHSRELPIPDNMPWTRKNWYGWLGCRMEMSIMERTMRKLAIGKRGWTGSAREGGKGLGVLPLYHRYRRCDQRWDHPHIPARFEVHR